MRNRHLALIAAALVSAVLGGVLVQAQARAGDRPWHPPRTPWGDPDLQGVYTNSNEYSTPFERPARFAGRRIEDLTPAEWAAIRAAATPEAVAALRGGEVRGPDDWWLQNLDLTKRHQPWLVVDPPDGVVPALTPEAKVRLQGVRPHSSFLGGPFNGPEDVGMLERCISRSIPGSMIPVMYGNNYQIVQAPGLVAITYEIIHETRIIPIEPRPHIGADILEHMGDARGHWEGDALVVETTNFTRASAYRNADPATLRVIERFVPVAPDRIDWSATLDDPHTWVRPWTIAMPLTADPQPIFPYDCHEHNYGLRNILSAARAAERK